MKYVEIKHLQEVELRKRLAHTKQALFDARMKHKMQRLSNIMDLRSFKKDIAKLETALAKLPKKKPVKVKKETLITKQATAVTTENIKAQNKISAVLKSKPVSQKKSQTEQTKKELKQSKLKDQKPVEIKKELKQSKLKDQKPVEIKKELKQSKLKDQKSVETKTGVKKILGETTKQSKPKKWFGFLKSRATQAGKKVGKKSFFRRKSG